MHTQRLRRYLLLSLIAMTSLAGIMAIQLAQTSNADAAVVGFCGNVELGPMNGTGLQSYCQAETVYSGLYQAYAWGEHSVCIEIQPWYVERCSTGTNGVYSGEISAGYGKPTLENHTNTNNYASAVYLTH